MTPASTGFGGSSAASFDGVLAAIAITPSAPVLVPELAGAAAAETAEIRAAVLAAVATLPRRWVAVGVGAAESTIGSRSAGTFAGYGVDVKVGLSAAADQPGELPLSALFAGWVRGLSDPAAEVEVLIVAADAGGPAAVARGRRLRTELDAADEAVGVLIVADGATTLTPPAPGGFDPGSVAVQHSLDDALAGGDIAALSTLPASIVGRAAFALLAGLAEPAPRSAKELYCGAPYGVGYFVGVWAP